MDTFARILGLGLLFLGGMVLLSIVAAVPVYFLWNWLMPKLFTLTTVTFWEAWGLTYLCAVLFKSSSTTSSK